MTAQTIQEQRVQHRAELISQYEKLYKDDLARSRMTRHDIVRSLCKKELEMIKEEMKELDPNYDFSKIES